MAHSLASTPQAAAQFSDTSSASGPVILVHSDDFTIREQVLRAVGSRLGPLQGAIQWREVATADAALSAVQAGDIDLIILDGEAQKAGGMGLCRQVKNEIFQCPPVIVLTGRPQDAWLAAWSMADVVIARPLDPIEVQQAVVAALATA